MFHIFRKKSDLERAWEWFASLFYGKFGLAKTFWLYYVIGRPLVFWTLNYVAILINLRVIDAICFVLTMAYTVIVLFGLWNAGTRYKEQHKDRKFWGYAVQLFTVYAGLGLANQIVFTVFMWSKMPALYPFRPETYLELFQRLPQIIDMAVR